MPGLCCGPATLAAPGGTRSSPIPEVTGSYSTILNHLECTSTERGGTTVSGQQVTCHRHCSRTKCFPCVLHVPTQAPQDRHGRALGGRPCRPGPAPAQRPWRAACARLLPGPAAPLCAWLHCLGESVRRTWRYTRSHGSRAWSQKRTLQQDIANSPFSPKGPDEHVDRGAADITAEHPN